MDLERKIVCPDCRKPKCENSGSASITAFMFKDAYCSCHSEKSSIEPKARADSSRCPHCDRIVTSTTGSITSLLFDELYCRCTFAGDGEAKVKSNARLDANPEEELPGVWDSRLISDEDARAMLELHEGDMIGAYRISKQIGRGGMGIVYLASHLALNRTCALKFLAPSLVTSMSWRMFQNEAKTIAGLTHPAICQIYDLGVHRGNLPYYAMEYVPGKTLFEILCENGPLSVDRVNELFSKMAEGLAYAHSHGIVHKDIKPANIMLVQTADDTVDVKILDFGIAELMKPGVERPNIPTVGTAFYMSPEQFKAGALDQRSDIYSLGCSMFEALTGRPPFSGSRSELPALHAESTAPLLSEASDEKFSRAIEAITRKCLAKFPEKRYQSAEQLSTDLTLLTENQLPQFAQDELNELAKLEEKGLSSNQAPALSPNMTVLLILAAFTLLIIGGYITVVSYVDGAEVTRQKDIEKRKKKELARERAAANRETVDIKTVLAKADTAFKENRYADVIALADNAFSKGASSSQLHLVRGFSLAKLEQPERAISDLEAARKLEPELKANVYFNDSLANNYAALADSDRALSAIERSIKLSPSAERMRLKGHILCQLGRYADARDILTEAIKIAPDQFWLYFDRGSCNASLNQHKKALEDFSTAIRLRPTEPKCYGARARSYLRLGKKDLAKQDMARAQQLSLPEWNYFESNQNH
jgi:serine/threonine protein kinase/Flp pilus assembly protein TadD